MLKEQLASKLLLNSFATESILLVQLSSSSLDDTEI